MCFFCGRGLKSLSDYGPLSDSPVDPARSGADVAAGERDASVSGDSYAAGGAPPASAITGPWESQVAFLSGVTTTATIATVSYGAWNFDTPATYDGPWSYVTKFGSTALNVNGTAGGTITYWFDAASNWTPTEKSAWVSAMTLWSSVANLSFAEASGASGAGFQIVRGSDRNAFQSSPEGSYVPIGGTNAGAVGDGAYISIDTSVPTFGPIGSSFETYGGYPWGTMVHEIGHLLGLGHAGPYNGAVNPATQQFSAYDNLQWSIMSYISPETTTARFYASNPVSGTSWGRAADFYSYTPTTPMMLDIVAIQRLYGAPTTGALASGGATYGFNSTISGSAGLFFDFTVNAHPVITIYNAGTGNTLDLSGYSAPSTINLTAGSFSSANGMVNNIAIAVGTMVETAIGGAGNDTITGNAANNVLNGGAGADSMAGGGGADSYYVDVAGDIISEASGEGVDAVYTALSSYALAVNVEALVYTGSGAFTGSGNTSDNALAGGGGADSLTGGAGLDTLNGGVGADTLVGGTGSDVYIIDNAGDVVSENASEGTDTVHASLNYALGANVENLVLSGSAVQGVGNSSVNSITGTASANYLDGGAGADALYGLGGDDTYIVDNSFDQIIETVGEGADTVHASVNYSLGSNVENLVLAGAASQGVGNVLANAITGTTSGNYLDGGSGADVLSGLAGDDVYVIDNSFDQIVENASEGVDLVNSAVNYALGANIENLTLSGVATQGVGNALANVISGTGSANYLDGGAGADALYGLGGDDVYVIDSSFDQIVENAAEGTDLVYAAVSFQLGANVENLQLQGAAIQGIGNALVNTITGTALANYIDGGGGADGLIGGDGHDTYVIDSSFDQIVENSTEGTDTVYSSVSFQIGANLELLYLTGAAVQGIGNALVNTITGTAEANVLSGGGGVGDVLTGNGGNDVFLFIAGLTNGTTIMDFVGNGAGAGDSLAFQGFGAGAVLAQDSAITWRITYNGGASSEVFNLANSAAIHASDYSFA